MTTWSTTFAEVAGVVWHTSLAAAVVAVFILFLESVFRNALRPRLRLALWWLVALRLIMPGPFSSSLSVWNLWRPSAKFEAALTGSESPAPGTGAPLAIPPAAETSATEPQSRSSDWFVVLRYVWLFGAIASLALVLLQQRKLARWAWRQPTLANLQETLAQAVRRLGVTRNVRVVETTLLSSPAVFGILRPHILIPRHLLTQMSGEQLLLVLLHELAHIKRGDVLQNWLLILLQSIHWFNPVIWMAFRRLRTERELVCDETVLGRIDKAQQTLYGSTLIHIASSPLPLRALPVLVPILSNKKQIERRVKMIAKFKPTSPAAAVAAVGVLVSVAWVTLTGAADPPAQPREPTVPLAPPQAQVRTERTIALMEEELARLDAQIRQKQGEVDGMRIELRISPVDETGNMSEPEVLRKMEALHLEQAAEHEKLKSLYMGLTNMSRRDLLRAISTASPDALLTSLLEQRAKAEQKLAEARDSFGPDHPNTKATGRLREQIEAQVQQRLDGILEGLKVRTATLEGTARRMQKEVLKAREGQIEDAIKARPYFRAKRELQNLESAYDELHKRVTQARIEASITPK